MIQKGENQSNLLYVLWIGNVKGKKSYAFFLNLKGKQLLGAAFYLIRQETLPCLAFYPFALLKSKGSTERGCARPCFSSVAGFHAATEAK